MDVAGPVMHSSLLGRSVGVRVRSRHSVRNRVRVRVSQV